MTATVASAETAGEPEGEIIVNGAHLIGDLSGALWWPAHRTLIVADLHLEKGSSFAASGMLLPPYDTAATLTRLADVLRRRAPARVICLGDSFHDRSAAARMTPDTAHRLDGLVRAHDWVWVTGNHDPDPPARWGGTSVASTTVGPLVFRHEAIQDGAVRGAGEISGHYHPKASVTVRNRRIGGRCFVTDGARLVMPAFGAYAGGLDVLDRAIASLFAGPFDVRILGRTRLFAFPHSRLGRGR